VFVKGVCASPWCMLAGRICYHYVRHWISSPEEAVTGRNELGLGLVGRKAGEEGALDLCD